MTTINIRISDCTVGPFRRWLSTVARILAGRIDGAHTIVIQASSDFPIAICAQAVAQMVQMHECRDEIAAAVLQQAESPSRMVN